MREEIEEMMMLMDTVVLRFSWENMKKTWEE